MFIFLGQQVVEEVLDAQRPGCPPEYFNIEVPKDHAVLDPTGHGNITIPFLRSRYDMGRTGFSPNSPREQVKNGPVFVHVAIFSVKLINLISMILPYPMFFYYSRK